MDQSHRLTIKRRAPSDLILIPIVVFNPKTEAIAVISAELDTGNDHTVVRRDIIDRIGVEIGASDLTVHGVGGSSIGSRAIVTIGIKFDDSHRCEINQEVVVVENLAVDVLLGREMLRHLDIEIRRDGTTIVRL